jgi:hypothetical protein
VFHLNPKVGRYIFPPPGRFPLSLPCRLQACARPLPSLAAPRLPLLPRPAEEHRLAILFFPAARIEPEAREPPLLAAVSPAGPDHRRLELLTAGLSSGQAYLTGELRVSRRSSWTSSPPPCWPEPPPQSRPALCRPGPSCPAPVQAGLPCGPRAHRSDALGQSWPSIKSSCKLFLFPEF